jgi:hypothetical protein
MESGIRLKISLRRISRCSFHQVKRKRKNPGLNLYPKAYVETS